MVLAVIGMAGEGKGCVRVPHSTWRWEKLEIYNNGGSRKTWSLDKLRGTKNSKIIIKIEEEIYCWVILIFKEIFGVRSSYLRDWLYIGYSVLY